MVLIKLIIKAPNQRLEDQTISCDLEWTVFKLKAHLSIEYPTKPRIEDQRLIYSGHLLKNEQSLRQVLQPIDDFLTFTIHLVCTQRSNDSYKSNNYNMAANNAFERLNNSTNESSQQPNESNAANNINANGISYNPLNATPNLVQTFFESGVTTNAGPNIATPEQMLQQMALLQQAYAQYMAQYFGQNPYINSQLMGTQTVINNQTTNTTVPQPAQPIPPVNGPQLRAEIPEPPQIQRLNAGPGGGPAVDDEEDPNNRDWLDWFYWMSRALVLFSIIYFYSSFNRFLLVVVLAIMLYLYQTNWINRRRLPINNNNNNNINVAPIVANNDNNNDNNRDDINRDEHDLNDGIDGEETEILERPRPHMTSNTDISEQNRPTEERYSGLRFFWVIVSSLFTSLIPENPGVPVNLN